MKKKRVLVAMSGGVDSSVAACLLKDQGYSVVGATLQVWDYSKTPSHSNQGTCCSSSDVEDARAVCKSLQIPFYVINCEDVFKETVIDPFVRDYKQGKTPIPCTNCNTFLKFHYLVDKMRELNCDYLATGHYAEIKTLASGKQGIFVSKDKFKDQTYFLFTLNSKILPHLLFPLGSLDKTEVRKLAQKQAIPVFDKKDSTGICFIGKGKYQDFVENYEKPSNKPDLDGEIRLYPSGELLAKHKGIHHFTIGQRKGLGVSFKHPLYVVKILAETKEVWLGEKRYLYSEEAEVSDLNFLDGVQNGECLQVKIRFHHQAAPAFFYRKPEGYQIRFLKPQKAIAPGQSAVFYRNHQLVGGGVITKAGSLC